jgi:hypothetical protein
MKMLTEVYPETLEQFQHRKLQNPETRSHARNTDSEFHLVVARDKKTAFIYVAEVYFG